MIKIGICDDDQLIRAGLRMIIDQEPDLEVVAEAGTGAEAIVSSLLTRSMSC